MSQLPTSTTIENKIKKKKKVLSSCGFCLSVLAERPLSIPEWKVPWNIKIKIMEASLGHNLNKSNR
jgi:hypothetical protein